MLRLKTFIETTGLSETASMVLRMENDVFKIYAYPRDIDLDLRDAETGKPTDRLLSPYILRYAHTEKSEALLGMRVKYWSVSRLMGCIDIWLTK